MVGVVWTVTFEVGGTKLFSSCVSYLWFEVFPLVFGDIYHFNLGVSGLPFTAFVVSGASSRAMSYLYRILGSHRISGVSMGLLGN